METELLTSAPNGSFAAVTGATKSFVAAHPIGMAVAGGALLGFGTYYVLRKMFGKKKDAIPSPA